MTENRAVECVVAYVAEAFPTPAWSVETLRLYASELSDCDPAVLQDVAREWVRSQEGRPTIAHLRKAVAAQLAAAIGSPYLEPDEAWAYVIRCFTRVGRYRQFPGRHPLVAATVATMGWEVLCDSDNQEASRAHFLQLYRQQVDRARREDATNHAAEPRAATGRLVEMPAPKRLQ